MTVNRTLWSPLVGVASIGLLYLFTVSFFAETANGDTIYAFGFSSGAVAMIWVLASLILILFGILGLVPRFSDEFKSWRQKYVLSPKVFCLVFLTFLVSIALAPGYGKISENYQLRANEGKMYIFPDGSTLQAGDPPLRVNPFETYNFLFREYSASIQSWFGMTGTWQVAVIDHGSSREMIDLHNVQVYIKDTDQFVSFLDEKQVWEMNRQNQRATVIDTIEAYWAAHMLSIPYDPTAGGSAVLIARAWEQFATETGLALSFLQAE